MKSILSKTLALLLLGASTVFAHQAVELGPNGGRILEFSKNETMHGEVTSKKGKFHIALLDKDMKPVSISAQTLTAMTADRNNPQKLEIEVKDDHFVMPMLAGNEYTIIFQYRNSAEDKPITARLLFDAANCDGCNSPEWLCKCAR
jgi:hypothetical protein